MENNTQKDIDNFEEKRKYFKKVSERVKAKRILEKLVDEEFNNQRKNLENENYSKRRTVIKVLAERVIFLKDYYKKNYKKNISNEQEVCIVSNLVAEYPDDRLHLLNNYLSKDDFLNNFLYSKEVSTEEDIFSTYFEAGVLLGLTELQSKYFAAKALDFERQEIIEVTGRTNNNVDKLKAKICDKFNSGEKTKEMKDKLIKELAESISHPDSMEAARKFFNGGMREMIEVIEDYKSDKFLADKIKSDPKKLALIDAVENNPELLDKFLDQVAEQNSILLKEQILRD